MMPSVSFRMVQVIKGAVCIFGEEIQTQNFNIYNINEAIICSISE